MRLLDFWVTDKYNGQGHIIVHNFRTDRWILKQFPDFLVVSVNYIVKFIEISKIESFKENVQKDLLSLGLLR